LCYKKHIHERCFHFEPLQQIGTNIDAIPSFPFTNGHEHHTSYCRTMNVHNNKPLIRQKSMKQKDAPMIVLKTTICNSKSIDHIMKEAQIREDTLHAIPTLYSRVDARHQRKMNVNCYLNYY
jgi:hypothetical protein